MAPLSDDYTLTIRQGPERAKVAGPKEKGEQTRPRIHTLDIDFRQSENLSILLQ